MSLHAIILSWLSWTTVNICQIVNLNGENVFTENLRGAVSTSFVKTYLLPFQQSSVMEDSESSRDYILSLSVRSLPD